VRERGQEHKCRPFVRNNSRIAVNGEFGAERMARKAEDNGSIRVALLAITAALSLWQELGSGIGVTGAGLRAEASFSLGINFRGPRRSLCLVHPSP
jgi:hypothetical protein